MNDVYQNSHRNTEPLNDRLEFLFIEIELAVKWQRPSILLAIYPAEDIHAEAEAALENKIIGFGQSVVHIRGDRDRNPDLSLLVSRVPEADKSVFFVDGLGHGGERERLNIYRTLNVSREYFVEKQIRIVFWLTEAEAVSLAHFAPDFWASRHRVVDFIELEKPEPSVVRTLESAWQGQGEYKHMNDNLVDNHAKISLRETTQAGLPEWDGSTTAGVNLLLTLGIMHWRKGDHDKADESLRSALEIAIKTQEKRLEAVCFNAIALVKTDLGKFDEAVEAYEQAIELAPEKTFIWGHLGNLYTRLGLHAEAVEAFLNTLEHNPVDSIAWNGLGNAYANTGRVDEAIEAYRKAVELNDCFIEPWISLGNLFKKQNLNADAIKAYQKAAGMDPNNALAWNELGNIYFELGDFDPAVDAYNIAIRLGVDTGWSYCNLATAYTYRDEYASAIPFYQQGVELLKNDEDKAVAWNRLGDAYRQVKDYDNAISAYQNADRLMDAGASATGSQLDYLHSLIAGEQIADELPVAATEMPAETAGDEVLSPAADGLLSPESPTAEEAADQLPVTEAVSEAEAEAPETEQLPEETAPEAAALEAESVPVPDLKEQVAQSEPDVTETAPVSAESVENEAAGPETDELEPAEAGADLPNDGASTDEELPADEEIPAAESVTVPELLDAPADETETEEAGEPAASPEDDSATEPEPLVESVVLEIVPDADAAADDEGDTDAPGQDLRNAQIWNELGNIYFKVGAYDEALEAYNKAIELGLELGLLYSNLGYACAFREKYAESIPLYQKGIELLTGDPDRAIAWGRLADAYLHLDDCPAAISAYGKALELDPENVAFARGLNAACDRQAELDLAAVPEAPAETTDEAADQVEEAPLSPAAPAEAVSEQDDADDPATTEDESDDGVVAGVVSRLFADEALPDVVSPESVTAPVETVAEDASLPAAQTEEPVPDVPAQQVVAVAEIAAEDRDAVTPQTDAAPEAEVPEAAAAPMDESGSAREIDLKNAHIWNELGNIFAKASAFDDAIDAYHKASELDPGFGWPYSNLGLAYAQKGMFGEAVPLYQKSIERFDSNKDKAISWNRLGDAYRQLNEYDNAIAAYQIADELNQDGSLPQTDLREMNVRQASPIFSYLSGGPNDRF